MQSMPLWELFVPASLAKSEAFPALVKKHIKMTEKKLSGPEREAAQKLIDELKDLIKEEKI